MIKLIYVAAPYTSSDPNEKKMNVEVARFIGYKLAKAGFYPVMPTVNTNGFCEANNEEFWYAATLELMTRCNAVYVCDGSHNSKGVAGECFEAEQLNMPLFHSIEQLIEWFKHND